MIQPFSIGCLPRIEFGAGRISLLPGIAARFGQRLLLVTGEMSFLRSEAWPILRQGLAEKHLDWDQLSIEGEPSPEVIDQSVASLRQKPIDVVIGIGGGSVLDAAKAIAGLLRPGNSVMDHLEGVGPELPYRGPATPFIAVPTTAGTGSEATKNAVLTKHGAQGFKKSFRDERLTACYAIVDPDLLSSCPLDLIAANGMDALTQLMEAFVSTRSNPLTDALALSGIQAVIEGLIPWYESDPVASIIGREKMAYAALLSGICLAQTGLGSVHGLAQPLGSFFPIPHGVVCGTLLTAAVEVNIQVMQSRAPDHPALKKYAHLGRLFLQRPALDDMKALDGLVEALKEWTVRLHLPPLSVWGVMASDFRRIVDHSRGSSMKTNPVVLSDEEIEQILHRRLN